VEGGEKEKKNSTKRNVYTYFSEGREGGGEKGAAFLFRGGGEGKRSEDFYTNLDSSGQDEKKGTAAISNQPGKGEKKGDKEGKNKKGGGKKKKVGGSDQNL